MCFAKRQGQGASTFIRNNQSFALLLSSCMYWVAADTPITITYAIIQIPIETACIRTIIPITA